MSQPPIKDKENNDTPTHRYDLMQMRVDEIQGLVTILQYRRTLHISKAKQVRAHSEIADAKRTNASLSATMDKLEKRIEKMKKDDEAIVKLLNEARTLIFEASDGTLILEKTEKMDGSNQG